jgi:hypothetical protein
MSIIRQDTVRGVVPGESHDILYFWIKGVVQKDVVICINGHLLQTTSEWKS